MQIRVKLDEGAYMPEKAYRTDAGFDIKTPVLTRVETFDSATVDTGVHVEIPAGYVGFLKSKSGLNVRDGITTDGVIDAGYTGSIVVKIYNKGRKAKVFKPGDKITQLVILPICDVEMVEAESIDGGERGERGFGSSGK